jgi:tetratricopeptide (TPR) repeat protein
LGSIFSGWTPGKVDYREQLLGDLEKIKYSKRTGHFDDALRLVNELLHREPDFPDAMYLKAHILWEGFENAEAAKAYLKKVKELVPKNEPLHQWASSYYDEVTSGMKES